MAISSSLITKLKVQLKLAINRLRMTQQKDMAIAKQQRREMAHLLEQSREASALIRTENIIRSDIITELHEELELYCELLIARSGLLEQTPCDAGLEEAVKSIIYAAPRTEIRELQTARSLLCEKFGKEFAEEAIKGEGVSTRVVSKLRVEPPRQELVRAYLEEIARTYGIVWPRRKVEDDGDAEQDGEPDGADSGAAGGDNDKGAGGGGGGGGQKERALEDPLLSEAASPPKGNVDASDRKPPVQIAPASPSTENPSPRVKLPGGTSSTTSSLAQPSTPSKPKPAAAPAQAPAQTSTSATSSSLGAGVSAGVKKSAPSTALGVGSGATAASSAASKDVARVDGKIPDVDELAKRFAALKR